MTDPSIQQKYSKGQDQETEEGMLGQYKGELTI